jgi:steroid delta-isomerase-like uncharacterized protein
MTVKMIKLYKMNLECLTLVKEENVMNDSKTLVQEYIKAYSDHDIQKIRQLLHPQYTSTGIDGKQHKGIEEGVQIASMYLNAFPDMKIDLQNILSIGDVAVVEYVSKGTQKGEFLDIDPTNKQVNIPVCEVIECRDGKIYSERDYFDAGLIMQQLGGRSGIQDQE